MTNTKTIAAKSAKEKTSQSFIVEEPVIGGSSYRVTLKPGAAAPLFNLIDSEATGSIREHLFKLVLHIASCQSALFEASEDALGDKANFRVDPSMPDVFWTIEELYTLFDSLEIEFTRAN